MVVVINLTLAILTAGLGATLTAHVLAVGRTLDSLLGPAKLNYETLGNSVPHLHTHVVPRGPDDPTRARFCRGPTATTATNPPANCTPSPTTYAGCYPPIRHDRRRPVPHRRHADRGHSNAACGRLSPPRAGNDRQGKA